MIACRECFSNFGRFMAFHEHARREFKAKYWRKLSFFLFFLQQENVMISQKTNLSDYYESLRNNVITLLEQSRRPNDPSNERKQQERVESVGTKL